MRPHRFFLVTVGLLLLGACSRSPQVPLLKITPSSFYALPDWQQDHDIIDGFRAFCKSCPVLLKMPANRPVGLGTNAGDWHPACRKALELHPKSAQEVRDFFETYFTPYKASDNGNHEGLFTGYYESELHGSRVRSEKYAYPLYRKPSDLVMSEADKKWGRFSWGRLIPYYDRASIDEGALEGQGLELVWVDDPVEAFFLHIQGSGRVNLKEGGVMRVGYAGVNGHPFIPIGRKLAEGGYMDLKDVSMQSIRKWMKDNPKRARELMHQNPSYVFFREIPGDGPIGCMGIPVTPKRSMAVDKRIFPMGAPIWFDGYHPDNHFNHRHLMVAQDTGGAIRGAVRGDFFWGFGKEAMEQAGKMKSKGQYYIFLPKAASPAKHHTL